MMPNQSYNQFQRGSGCNQGRPSASCQQIQPRPQQRPMPSCSQTQQRTAPSCSQTEQRPAPSCSQTTPPRVVSGPSCPCSQMSQGQLLEWIFLTKFACVDSSLYLDTHPEDQEALDYFQEYNRLYNEAMDLYAKTYGPLTIAHAKSCGTYWNWVNMPWPWQ